MTKSSLFAFLTFVLGVLAQNNSQITWNLVGSGPWEARQGVMGCAFNNTIYLSGGRNGQTYFSDVWKYDLTVPPAVRKWELANAAAPFGNRSYHIMIVHDGAIYVMGGENLTHMYNDVWYSLDGTTWINLVPDGLPSDIMYYPRAGLAAISYNDYIYLTCGAFNHTNRLFFSDVWRSPDGETWTLIQPDAAYTGRSGPRLVVYQDKMYLSAGEHGFSGVTQYDDVWESTDGVDWKLVTRYPHTQWDKRSGHGMITDGQDYMYVVAGYYDKYDFWRSSDDGRNWELISNNVFNCDENQSKCGRFDFWTVLVQDPMDNNNWYCYIYGGDSDWTTTGGERDETWVGKIQDA